VELQGDEENISKFKDLVVGNLGIQSGAGLKLLMEGRDNRLNAKHGLYTDISYQIYRKDLGGDYNYDLFQADVRYYTPLYRRIILATQVRTESRTGNAPLQSLSMIGGDYTMRGIYRGRFRDNVSVDGQMELRFPLFWIFSGVVFNGIGEVAPSYEKLSTKGMHYTYGAGLRVQMDSKHDVNLRFDVGRSYERTIFVVNISEAF
jgi:outer membrane protein assembly factor BamA